MEILEGNVLRAEVYFTDPTSTSAPVDAVTGETLIDPDTVAFVVQSVGAAAVTYTYGTDDEVTRVSQGHYKLAVVVTGGGERRLEVRSTGTGQAAEDAVFNVRASEIT